MLRKYFFKFTILAFIATVGFACKSKQEKNTAVLIETIESQRQAALKTNNLTIAFIETCEKQSKNFRDSLSANNKDGKLRKKSIYKEAEAEIEAYKKMVDTLKSLYVASKLKGGYEGSGNHYYYNEQYNMSIPNGVMQAVLNLNSTGYSTFRVATTSINGRMTKEEFQISVGEVNTLNDSIIKGSINYKSENSNENKYYCNFEWSRNVLNFHTTLWSVDNKRTN
ncbi:MAG: hypothetical protein ORN56_08300 [Chitinophagales bacterium]|jgi:hypothetical protein|nr:hypothetical protein [Chitinophagales bacterium]